jgi:hypothetical protein
LPSLQYTTLVLSGCSRNPTWAILSPIARRSCERWTCAPTVRRAVGLPAGSRSRSPIRQAPRCSGTGSSAAGRRGVGPRMCWGAPCRIRGGSAGCSPKLWTSPPGRGDGWGVASLGGTARVWRTDRLATVIVPGTGQVQPSFAPVARHYGVVVQPCPPRRGNRKGSVESALPTLAPHV